MPDTPEATRQSNTSQYPELMRKLLAQRGLKEANKIEQFLAPDYERDSHDPLLLKDIQKASTRIINAIKAKETIAVYSDYDADGIPGAVILTDFFKKIGYQQFVTYIPHRNREGFGFHAHAIDTLKAQGVSLIITVDCGSSDTGAAARAEELGVEVIVTDHHQPSEPAPVVYALVNPNQPGCAYPNKSLCGAGVAFKLVQALIAQGDFGLVSGWEKWLLDLVGIATVADMVSVRESENRMLATYGLLVLRKSRRPGILALCRALRMNQPYLTEDDIGFMIAPRINAASRMDQPELAYALLATEDPTEAETLVKTLDKLNTERKSVVATMTREVNQKLRKRGELPEVIVAGNPDWQPSLVGLVANSVMEEFGRPAFIWGRDEKGVLKGSCRGNGSLDVVALMRVAEQSLLEYGGHERSGGFSVSHETIHTLEQVLNEARQHVTTTAGDQVQTHDAELPLTDVTWRTYRLVQQLAPFGVDNPKPIFKICDAQMGEPEVFGKAKNHVATPLLHPEKNISIRAYRFFATPEMITKTHATSISGNLEKAWRGRGVEVRLV